MENQNTPPIPENSNATPVAPVETPPVLNTPKPKPKFPLAGIIGIIVFLLCAGSAAGFYAFKPQIMKLVSKPTPSPTITIQTSPTPTADPTANWIIYTGDGFSFKYPDKITELNGIVTVKFVEQSDKKNPDGLEQAPGYILTFQLFKNSQQNLKEFVSNDILNRADKDEISTLQSTLNGYTTISFSSLGGGQKSDNIYIDSGDGRIIRVTYSINDMYKKGYNQTINQILSTFKFTDQGISPTPSSASCNTDSDCPADSKCMTSGPLTAGQTAKKTCVKNGTVVPL